MSNGSSRPGGLTALAVLNFIFAGIFGLGLLFMVAALTIVNRVTDGKAAEKLVEAGGVGIVVYAVTAMAVIVLLLIVSGIGYLGQKRFLGRILGSLYGVLHIGSGIIDIVLAQQDFKILSMISFIFPALTLLLLNTIFKDDFVNP